ncbi:MAG: enoyl-CoA hydratase-related protein [Nocardioidaceae bacterium]
MRRCGPDRGPRAGHGGGQSQTPRRAPRRAYVVHARRGSGTRTRPRWGVGLVGACDVALASDESTFAFTESRLGLTPAVISLTTRTRLGDRDAAHKYLTGATFSASEAARSGLVTSAIAAADFDAAMTDLLAQLRTASPQGLRETKLLLNRTLVAHMDAEGDRLVALSAQLFASAEAREGMAAFRERRRPRWATESASGRHGDIAT